MGDKVWDGDKDEDKISSQKNSETGTGKALIVLSSSQYTCMISCVYKYKISNKNNFKNVCSREMKIETMRNR